MKKIDIGQSIQIIANAGVIAGLIFVGLQLQQERELAGIEATNYAQDSRIEWATLLSEGDNAQIWSKGINGELLSPPEHILFEALSLAFEMSSFTAFNNTRNLPGGISPSSIAIDTAAYYAKYPSLWALRLQRQAELTESTAIVGGDAQSRAWNIRELVEKLTSEGRINDDSR